MILCILILLLGAVLFCRISKPAGKAGKVFALAFGTMIGLAAGMIIPIVLSVLLPHQTLRPETDRAQLVAIGAQSQVEGVFFLASGRINTGQYYKYYYLLPDGGIKFGQTSVENATVYEEDRTDAYMAKTRKVYRFPTWIHVLLVPKLFEDQGDNSSYAFHVPKGTIRVEYSLDLP